MQQLYNVIIFPQCSTVYLHSFQLHCQLAVSGAYSICDCLYGCVVILFQNLYFSNSFSLILTKLGKHNLCANTQKL